jgi:cytochrome P450
MRKAAQQYGRFYALWLGNKPIYVISDPALVHEVLITRAAEFHKADLVKHAVGRFAGNGLFTNEGDFWRRQRKLAQPAFHYRRIEAYGATMVQQRLDLLAGWQNRVGQSSVRFDIAEEMTALTLGIVNKTLFNVDVRTQSEHRRDHCRTPPPERRQWRPALYAAGRP